jgi:hypothetical protein
MRRSSGLRRKRPFNSDAGPYVGYYSSVNTTCFHVNFSVETVSTLPASWVVKGKKANLGSVSTSVGDAMSGKGSFVSAVEHVRRMRGGAQSQLLRCSDGEYYVVKFQNNPQGPRILANELLATFLAKRLDLPVPEAAIVNVSAEFIRHTDELVIQLEHDRIPCRPGLCFGSRYPRNPSTKLSCLHAVQDLLPEGQFRAVTNISDFVGMLVFDKWLGNTDDRQCVYFREKGQFHYKALMIDHGFCFNGQEWNFSDVPRRGLCPRPFVYEGIRGIDAFDWWISRLEEEINENVLRSGFEAIPQEWYGHDEGSLFKLLEMLDNRRTQMRELLCATAAKLPKFFPNWTRKPSQPRERASGFEANSAIVRGLDSLG